MRNLLQWSPWDVFCSCSGGEVSSSQVVAAVIPSVSGKADLFQAWFWEAEVMAVLLALRRSCGYFIDCLATVNHVLSIPGVLLLQGWPSRGGSASRALSLRARRLQFSQPSGSLGSAASGREQVLLQTLFQEAAETDASKAE